MRWSSILGGANTQTTTTQKDSLSAIIKSPSMPRFWKKLISWAMILTSQKRVWKPTCTIISPQHTISSSSVKSAIHKFLGPTWSRWTSSQCNPMNVGPKVPLPHSDNLKPADLLKMISAPVEKQRSQSYYLGNHYRKHHDDNRSLGHHSVRIDQKKRSSSKPRKQRNKSMEREHSVNNSKFFKNPPKPKRVQSQTLRTDRQTSQWTNPRVGPRNHPSDITRSQTKIWPGRARIVTKIKWDWGKDLTKVATWLGQKPVWIGL